MEQEVNYDIYGLGDIEKIGEALGIIGFNSDDVKVEDRMSKINYIAAYLNQLPDPTYFVQHAVGNKQVDRVEFMTEYINLHEQLVKAKQKVDLLDSEIKRYEA